jgi:NitT/TauT family transport system permease protein
MVYGTFDLLGAQAAPPFSSALAHRLRPRRPDRAVMRANSWAGRAALVLAPWVLIVAIWYGVRASGLVSPALVPAPHDVAAKFVELMRQRLAIDILMSTQRVFVGVALGVFFAVPVGFCLGWYKGLRSFIDPVINFFRALPPIALIPLVIVYFGIGEIAKTVILFYASFFAGVIVMYEGIAQISPIYVRVARTLGANDLEIFGKVIVPLTIPHILTAIRVALGVAWATLVASELIAAQQGLGALIQNASAFFQLDIIYVGIICIGLIALAMDLALRAATRRLVAWQDRLA